MKGKIKGKEKKYYKTLKKVEFELAGDGLNLLGDIAS